MPLMAMILADFVLVKLPSAIETRAADSVEISWFTIKPAACDVECEPAIFWVSS